MLLSKPSGALLLALGMIPTMHARNVTFTKGLGFDGQIRELELDRRPTLYTGDFGDCLGGQSLLNVTKYDAGLYFDNSTMLFHLDGATSLQSEDVMLYLSINAYGQERYGMTIDPCAYNISTLCPMNATVPVNAWAHWNVTEAQVAAIPQIAYQLPDFDGFARLWIFANSSQTKIACFQATMKNGNSFSQPAIISSVLAAFTLVAIIASFATAIYGVSVPHMRMHYAHSLSVLVIFETLQAIYFSGALSLDWPSVLPAWWSNFAWAGGFIPVTKIIDSAASFAGIGGNSSQVGGAGSVIIDNQGGLAQQIYGRSLDSVPSHIPALTRRSTYSPNDPFDYNWAGSPVSPGMPIPGDWSGFAGTLSVMKIPAGGAFTVSLIWFLVAIGVVALLLALFKLSLEMLAKIGWIKKDRHEYFRAHWTGYLGVAILRTLVVASFAMMLLAMFQFVHGGKAGPIAIAAVVFVFFIVVIGGMAVYALRTRLRFAKFKSDPDRIVFQPGTFMRCIPCVVPVRLSRIREREFARKPVGSIPFVHWHFVYEDPNQKKPHEDQPYTKRFGWLSARYKSSRWWYFVFWLCQQFVRAVFIGGATSNPLAQVYGLFIVDILTLVITIAINPYESQRNTALAIWMLGICKVVTTGISIAFLPAFAIDRIVATVLGIVIIITQALLIVALLILVAVGVMSSWFSLTRNREYFAIEWLETVRIKYFEHVQRRALDKDAPPEEGERPADAAAQMTQALADAHTFRVNSVRRAPKIEDEDEITEMGPREGPTTTPGQLRRVSRTNSVSSRRSVSSIPRAARGSRLSWSSKDFAQFQAEHEQRSHTQEPNLTIRGHASVNSLSSLRNSRPMTPAREDEEGEAEAETPERRRLASPDGADREAEREEPRRSMESVPEEERESEDTAETIGTRLEPIQSVPEPPPEGEEEQQHTSISVAAMKTASEKEEEDEERKSEQRDSTVTTKSGSTEARGSSSDSHDKSAERSSSSSSQANRSSAAKALSHPLMT